MNVIMGFRDDYRWLSNFHQAVIRYDDEVWPSSEHLYQASKTLDGEWKEKIRKLYTSGNAKRVGKEAPIREDWNDIRREVMLTIQRLKYTQHPELAKLLLATGDAKIVEDNYWGDTFWGQCKGEGTNYLGKILMQVREELKGFYLL